jgi:hypothetical protein
MLKYYLHTILALDPASNMCSPSKRTSKSLNNVVPLNPRSTLNSTRLSKEKTSLNARVNAHSERNHRDNGKKSRRHLRHDRSKNLGWGVFAFPSHVFGHEEGSGLNLRHEGPLADSGLLSGRGKCRGDSHDGGDEDETELGHFHILDLQMRKERMKDVRKDVKQSLCIIKMPRNPRG